MTLSDAIQIVRSRGIEHYGLKRATKPEVLKIKNNRFYQLLFTKEETYERHFTMLVDYISATDWHLFKIKKKPPTNVISMIDFKGKKK